MPYNAKTWSKCDSAGGRGWLIEPPPGPPLILVGFRGLVQVNTALDNDNEQKDFEVLGPLFSRKALTVWTDYTASASKTFFSSS